VNCAAEMVSVDINSRSVRLMLGPTSAVTPYVYSTPMLFDTIGIFSHPLLTCLSRFISVFIVSVQFIIGVLSYLIGTPKYKSTIS
jgi:hypothetical protein